APCAPQPPGALVDGDLPGHLDVPAHLTAELCAAADGPARGLLDTAHLGIVLRLVALIGHEVEHLLHGPVDDDLAFYALHARFPPLCGSSRHRRTHLLMVWRPSAPARAGQPRHAPRAPRSWPAPARPPPAALRSP